MSGLAISSHHEKAPLGALSPSRVSSSAGEIELAVVLGRALLGLAVMPLLLLLTPRAVAPAAAEALAALPPPSSSAQESRKQSMRRPGKTSRP